MYEYINKVANDKKEINIIGIHYHQISVVVLLTMLSMRGTEL